MATELKKTGRKADRSEKEPEPAWEVARLFPSQGQWTQDDYFSLDTNRLVELCDGYIEVLPAPTMAHQLILGYVLEMLKAFATTATPKLGTALFAGLPVRLWGQEFRQPDIVFILAEHTSRMGNQFWDRADLVMEVVSDKNRPHDIKKKRVEYARAGIPEYWIIDPKDETITVLILSGKRKVYAVHGTFRKGERAVSKLLPGFGVDVTAALSQKP